jgi:minor histocompatibility antigen H13
VLQQRTYFMRVACAHVAGLLTAFAANSVTHLGQPALLYIVPSTLLTVLVTAASRSEVGRVWRFTDVASFGVPVKKR